MNTQKRKSHSKSSTAKRYKKMTRKVVKKRGGAKTKSPKKSRSTKKSPSPSSESSVDEDNGIFEEDGRVKRHDEEVKKFVTLPTPEYTAESKKKKDIDMYEKAIKRFYNERADVQALKAKPTDTREQREKKKQKFATFPKLIEESIFEEIEKQMQPELDKWDKQNKIREKQFGELIKKINKVFLLADKYEWAQRDEIEREYHWVYREWKPEDYPDKAYRLDEIEDRQARAYASFNEDGPVAQGDEHNPRTDIEAVLDTRIGNLSRYIETKWHGWEDAKPKSGRKMTDMLVEDFSIPGVVAELDNEEDVWEWHTNNMEIYDIQKWNASWEKANNDEYKESDEFQVDIKKEMKKTNKDRTTVIAELNQNIEKEKKLIRDAEEKEKREIAAAAEKRKRDDEAEESKHNKKQKLRERARMKKAMAEAALRPKPPAQKIRATPMPPAAGDGPTPIASMDTAPEPPAKKSATPMPPAAGDGPTTSTETISFKDADSLARENSDIKISESKTHPGNYYMVNTENTEQIVFTWIIPIEIFKNKEDKLYYFDYNGNPRYIDNFARIDAERAVNAKTGQPERFEIRTYSTRQIKFDYLINKQTGAISKIFD